MKNDFIKSNWHEIELSKSNVSIQSIEFRNSDNLKSFREKYNNSTFVRYKDKVYIWDDIDFHAASKEYVDKGQHDYLLIKLISEALLSQFYHEAKLFIVRSYGIIRITDYRLDISNNDFPYLNTYRHYNLTFSPINVDGITSLGFNITCGISHQLTWGIEDFETNDLSTSGLTILENGKVRADTVSIYKISNLFGDSSKLKQSIDKLTEESINISCCNSFVNEFFVNGKNYKLPDNLEILNIRKINFSEIQDTKGYGFELLPNPKFYFYGNSTPPESADKFPMRSKIKYNKPTSYDSFENRTITIGVVFPKPNHLKISRFMKAVQEELCEIYRIQKSNFEYITFPIEDSQLSSYQSVFQETTGIDLAIVVVDEIHELLPIKDSPYYFCKAEFIKRGINSQEVQIQQINKFISDQESGYSNYADHNISLNIYAKLGGTAWTVKSNPKNRNELVIGVGATTDSEGTPQIGMTSIFQGDGKYLVGNVAAVTSIVDYNKHLNEVLSRNIQDCLDSKILDSAKPIYLVFHLFKKPGYHNEIDALSKMISEFSGLNFKYSFVYVGDGHNFRFNKYQLQEHEAMPLLKDLPRGTFIKVNDSLGFLSLRKNSSTCCKIEIDDRSNLIDIEYLSKQVYDFSNLSHSSFNKQASPASIKYSKLMAQMSTKLKTIEGFYMSHISMPDNSPWFL
ncbi:hypothetical protein GCM10009430_44880 [Aquimarina litoralis]|uniref:Protein argonaute n=1 Tax=Aquimarina litoralis TaxID=584605 RepID=A0ABN1J8S3_9FLAO